MFINVSYLTLISPAAFPVFPEINLSVLTLLNPSATIKTSGTHQTSGWRSVESGRVRALPLTLTFSTFAV